MKLVRFNRALAPYQVGDTRVVPDHIAEQLSADGEASVVPSVFDKSQSESHVRPKLSLPGHRYQTRKGA